jgi:hypothetical protein
MSGGDVMQSVSALDGMTGRAIEILPPVPGARWRIVNDLPSEGPLQPSVESAPSEPSSPTTNENVPADYQGFSIDVKLVLDEMERMLGPMYLNAVKYPNIAKYIKRDW